MFHYYPKGQVKNKKSIGTDGLSSEVFKLLAPPLAPVLLQLFNKCISVSALPWSMTRGLITDN